MRLDHWSWAYARAKTKVVWFQWRHPEWPWLTVDAVRRMDAFLRPDHCVLEWGAGRSTAWFASRAGKVISIEHDPEWHARVSKMLDGNDRMRVDLRLAPVDSDEYIAPSLSASPFDLILVDGRRRDECAHQAIDWVAPGGWLVIDDAERYLPLGRRPPSISRTPPDLRGRGDEAATPLWSQVADRLADWTLTWTSDGVSDTVVWERPGSANGARQGEHGTNE